VPSGSAPGKVILFGEHAVVFGQPATAVAVNLRTEVDARQHGEWRVDGASLDDPKYAYVRAAVRRAWEGDPLQLEIRSMLPLGAGMGSSAAVTVATLAVLRGMRNFDSSNSKPWIARAAFDIEFEVQRGMASPIDTSTATAGGGLLVLSEQQENCHWHIQRGERVWYMHPVIYPPFTLVVGSTGVAAPTGPLVALVRELVDRKPEARHAVEEIGSITLEGSRALLKRDLVRAGELMTRNHALLNSLGVGHALLDRFVAAALPHAYGAKLTGAGGGGSMIALTDKPEKVSAAIEAVGGRVFAVSTEPFGVRVTS